ncbi:outer membrane lipoprotein carrier protein LolA [Stutzerimonas nitrititolerans]|uniref:Outer membrane lipoprotein carrier protein LolA n=1 Tax=Stutzerimonas nitrititolerans TaxID=2482751 RepID=A0ABX9V8L2_9GAMM|nr:outer membrane lipoprotein carrier protein LolA [Stutzerimonas nitrititolerans]RMI02501.1 outer membrane lipoprotein carrier protein LolA [Stutzerimonas nitrititolerans]
MIRNLAARTFLTLCLTLTMAAGAQAFDLAQLSQQLREPAVIRGQFVQQKHLRALPLPLVSRGQFVLAREHGLLWSLQQPLQQDYRISGSGIAQRTPSGWESTDQQPAAARQNQLFLAVLGGDAEALQRDFQLDLLGTAEDWTLTLTPRSKLLQQIFSAIHIQGGATARRIELLETQGDSTLLLLESTEVDDQLSAVEQHDFTH